MTRLLLLLFFFTAVNTYAQQSPLTGRIVDTSENAPLHNAVIHLVRTADSVLIKFTRSDKEGRFSLTRVPTARYFVLVTYPGYADYVEERRDTTGVSSDLGSIPLTKKSQLLEAVIVTQKLSAIRMKGDTLEYKADSFKVQQGETVDALLKKLPGIQVDKNGQITAQGQKVNKVLVDGDEFFSDDPAVVIKNLQAEAVKDVQVYDKKSDQAEFTGIDDGQRNKTINLTLKPDKKKGYFVKASLNGSPEGSFDNDLMANYFKGTRKMAAFGIMSNTGRSGLDWQEMDRFGGGNNVEFNEDEGYYMFTGTNDEFSESYNNEEGLPTAWSAGFHFSDKWNGDNKKFNGNYRFLKKNLRAESAVVSQYILPDTQYFNNQASESFSSRIGHQAKAIYDLKTDSLSSFKMTVTANTLQSDNASRQHSAALNADSGMVNRNERLLNSHVDKNNFNTNLLWRKKFRKTGRTLSVNVEQRYSDQDVDGILQSQTDYFNVQGENDRREITDQKKENSQNNFGINTNIVYTEPLSKTWFVSVNYGYHFAVSEAMRNSFNKGSDDFYSSRDSLFSNDFRFRYAINSGGADLKLNKKKMTLVVGTGVSHSAFRQTDLEKDATSRYSFINYRPKFVLTLKPSSQRRFRVTYDGSNQPPSLEQLQPVGENTDPLNVRIGNPLLRQEFRHSFNLGYDEYRVIAERGFYTWNYLNVRQNAISQSTTVDNGGKTIQQPVNLNGNYYAGINAGYHWKIKKPGIYMRLGGNVNISRSTNLLNGLVNRNDNISYIVYPETGKFNSEKFSFSIRPGFGYTFSRSSLRPDIKTKYFTSENYVSFFTKLPWKMEFNTSADINVRQKTSVFDRNNNSVKWDASIIKKLMKNNQLSVRLAIFDILDQNIGFNRTANSNFITENNYLTLRRYWTAGIQYNLSKNP